MNKKAFTLVELLAAIVIIAIIMGIVLPSAIKVRHDNQNKIYLEYEKMMAEYALVNSKKGDNTISLTQLINESDGLDRIKDECNGYVNKIRDNPLEYKAFINCENGYFTPGYNS